MGSNPLEWIADSIQSVLGKTVDAGLGFIDAGLDAFQSVSEGLAGAIHTITDPVMQGVSATIKYAVENPVEAIAMVVATMVGGPAGWSAATKAAVIAAGTGAQALIDGEDLGSALEKATISMVSAYAAATVGKAVTPGITNAVESVISNPDVAATVSAALTKGTVSGSETLIKTKGDVNAAANAFLASAGYTLLEDGVSYGVDKVAGIEPVDSLAGIETIAEEIVGEIGNELKESGFEVSSDSTISLAAGVKDAITAGIVAELTGQDVFQSVLTAASSEILDSIGKADFAEGIVEKWAPVAV